MSSSRPPKRARRIDSTEPPDEDLPIVKAGTPPPELIPPAPFEHDDKFWYEDGNVILVAERVGFRVYKGLLAAQSDVLRELFSDSHPADAQRIDGSPVVYVPDRAEEVRSLLSVLVEGKSYITKRDVRFEDLANWIRLAHKYGIADLLENALALFRSLFPSDFASWARRGALQSMHHSITAVNLARLTGTTTALPCALYECCQLPIETLLNGVVFADGTTEKLGTEDAHRCLAALPVLGAQLAVAVTKIADIKFDNACPNPTRCMKEIGDIRREALGTLKSREICCNLLSS
ncbi:uncharacterized protein C8Q71DRAFT_859090 [Rhodofomes roseus]|uniref:BTB domain-containing protein n=1 Tax=Rhodofomes roseus TaxID=34475 RepID=A0ABQ8KD25_9APHY|nr:uncharacterized protein C8Q71DRAFT_859090 [Rhodofomes roseus]KAH9835468.1 hypothetical protein C8Q71DRAFT_859090 [Rhodofomes roseus]